MYADQNKERSASANPDRHQMYTVRVPFALPDRTRIAAEEARTSVGDIEMSLKTDGRFHVFIARGFTSEGQAKDFFARSPAAIAWLLLQRGIAARASRVAQPVKYFPNPEEAAANLSKSLGVRIDGPVD
ncbi:MAG: hypothetical protein H0V78_01860 [Burkholderiales bacterium]|nr:hypothetical protein [Burkholderiales bacterium]